MIKKAKTKKCRVCNSEFTPYFSTTVVCNNLDCAITEGKRRTAKYEDKKRRLEKKEIKKQVEKFKRKSDYIKDAQRAFNAFIRYRDIGKPCICCGKDLSKNVIGGDYDCGHYRSVGSAPHLRFDEMNAHAQSKYCNRWLNGNSVNYRRGLIERIGVDEVERIEADQSPKKYSVEELIEIISHYRKLVREMKKNREGRCSVSGCNDPVYYANKLICQKHYFREMRTGTYDQRERKERIENPAGYQKLYNPTHVLSNSDGYVYEHRAVVYKKYGECLPNCEVCGKPTSWVDCRIDHIDEDVRNNNIKNLRPLCNGCNSSRTVRTKNVQVLTVDGITKRIVDWARMPDVSVTHNTIKRRIKDGLTPYDAVYNPSKTQKCKEL